MKRPSCWLFATALIVASSSAALAMQKTGWDGTWSGAWGGQPDQATSVTIANGRVVSFTYQGMSHPVASSNVAATAITYQDQGNVVTLTKRSETTAAATLQTGMGNATAVLTRQ
ncbi:MAG TPA: hypothetical protein VGG57_00350 [Stellaceae bacterium]|jgi:hypothetical protein